MLKLGVAKRVEPDGCLSRKSDSHVASRIPTGVVVPPYIYARVLIGSMSVISTIIRSRELDCAFITVYLSIGCRAIYSSTLYASQALSSYCSGPNFRLRCQNYSDKRNRDQTGR